jgi:predicted phage-related endonuclease
VKFTIIEAEQRSDEWRAARAGLLTGSRARDMLTKIKTGEAAARRDLRLQLVVERLTGKPQEDDYVNKEMQRGIDLEPAAIAEYEALTGLVVRRTGFIRADDLLVGCSLDGDVDNFTGIVEVKCPKSATHLQYINDGIVPPAYLPQLRHNAWVTDANWADFLSFDDRFPSELQVFYARATREQLKLDEYKREVMAFLAEVERDLVSVRTLAKAAA